jgi:hypothetical protein
MGWPDITALMGLTDDLELDENHVLPGFDGDPSEVRWATKSLGQPVRDTYRITADGRLLKAEKDRRVVPEEERPRYNEDIGGFEHDVDEMFGMLDSTITGWEDVEYHGHFQFYGGPEGELHRYDAKFTDGQLVEFTEQA